MKKSCFLACIICLLIAVVVSSEIGAAENGGVIVSIEAAGNVVVTESQILSKIRSRVGDAFDAATAEEDAKRIAGIEGIETSYYSTKVVEGKIQLTFVVVERHLVRSILFEGNVKFKDKNLKKKLGIKTGDFLDAVMVEEGRKKVRDYYNTKGYAFAKVDVDTTGFAFGKLVFSIEEGPRVEINSIKFEGNKAIAREELSKVLKVKKKKFLILPNYYAEKHVEKDITGLQNVYYERGFLNIRIEAVKKFNSRRNKVNITFVIEEGPAYQIGDIVFKDNKRYDSGRLLDEFGLKRGEVYNKPKVEKGVKAILKLYRENGFVDASVESSIRFVSEDTVDITVDITEGERFRIGRVIITGNEETQDKVIRRILDEYDFGPGKWYNADLAHGDGSGYLEKLIRRSAYAEDAIITPAGEMPGQKDAQVNITEGQTGSIMLGAGVASDSGVIGQLVFQQRNFDIKDKPKSFGEFITGRAFKGAGQILRIALEPGTELSRYSISFTEPYLYNRPISMDIVGSNYERERESYDEERLKGYLGFEKRYRNRWRRRIGFRVEDVDVASLDYDAPQEVEDDKGGNLIAGIKIGAGKDLTDDIFNPSKGYRFDIDYEQVGGDHTFGILSSVYRRYKTIHEDLAERKTILATKLLGATVVGDAPVFEKFYGGGMGFYGIRGFEYRGVSPLGKQTNVANPKKKDPIGSDWIILANAEVTVPLISDNFAALFFVDSGMVETGGYRAAVGTGIQILLPQWFGPVPMRFALAVPFMKDGDDDTEVFSFSVGRLF